MIKKKQKQSETKQNISNFMKIIGQIYSILLILMNLIQLSIKIKYIIKEKNTHFNRSGLNRRAKSRIYSYGLSKIR
jgi:hypothetical protein